MKPDQPETAQRTLRRRLLTFLLLPLAALLVLSIPFDYELAVAPSRDAYDYALTDTATELATRIYLRDGRPALDLPPSVEAAIRSDMTDLEFLAVYAPDGHLLAGDADLAPDMGCASGNPCITDSTLHGHRIRKATYRKVTAAGEATVVFAETTRKREHAQSRILTAMILPNVLLVTAALGLVYFGVKRGLEPLDRLGKDISMRSATDPTPLPLAEVPAEAEPMVRAMNKLIKELQSAAAAQQRFLANAAHQLKTPLAGLQTQLELAAEELPGEYRDRMGKLSDATSRLAHLTHQILALARSGPEANVGYEKRRMDLSTLLHASASSWFDTALAANIDLGFEPELAMIEGSEWMLNELLSNLISNAIRYTPAGGTVTARSGMDSQGQAFIEVEDTGPGIPAQEHERVFDRFYRPSGSTSAGTGLGLAIVKEVAERHEATITLRSASSVGTCIRVCFKPV
ncbi:sensor histidine kinase [Noviherbaspirillum denitrificans]|uniref:histidine kinase n=1 Tax=Noviherbaspirillum denitrificans TaxID=1968433 RepID=A0A254TG72_9BURK|nr:sensor histidine kinase [Noviherbaspirillum denitrificans]OWW20312.1 hypothetical protein AYR66_13225 [Noviherbaspirillum denitrificans]